MYGMIRAVAAENPEGVVNLHSFEGIADLFYSSAVRKFLVKTPELMRKQSKAKEKKGTKGKPDTDEHDENKKSTKGKKKKVESDDDEPPPSITYYIFIPKTPAITSKKRSSGSKSADDDSIQRGPFTLPMSKPYSSLLSAISTALPCLPENINESKITWKPKQNHKIQSHRTPRNFRLGKRKDTRQCLRRWRTRVALEPCCCTCRRPRNPWKMRRRGTRPTIHLLTFSSDLMVKQASFNQATKEHRAKLEETYPVGQPPQFPGRRVYFDAATGFYFEINSTRLGVWSSAMAQGKTDEKRPPSSNFFDANQRIKCVPAVAVPAVPAAPVIPAVAPAVPATPAIPFVADLLLASISTQGSGGGDLASFFPQLNPAVLPPAAAAPPPPEPRNLMMASMDISGLTFAAIRLLSPPVTPIQNYNSQIVFNVRRKQDLGDLNIIGLI
ncbi:hypothetical protein B0H13DRAFT_1850587 [Mycena leptocephala]|nr:hypothetical protein B0H13DRAFT_1850587 [Mycena leptocephala]